MPFDMLPEHTRTEIVRLKVVRDGIAGEKTWCQYTLGGRMDGEHCLLGWVLVACDWNEHDATKLAIDHLYPALPKSAQTQSVMESLYNYNDRHGRLALLRVIDNAIKKALVSA